MEVGVEADEVDVRPEVLHRFVEELGLQNARNVSNFIFKYHQLTHLVIVRPRRLPLDTRIVDLVLEVVDVGRAEVLQARYIENLTGMNMSRLLTMAASTSS